MVERKQWFTVTKYGISVAILHLEREYEYGGLVRGGRSSLFSTEMPARRPASRVAWRCASLKLSLIHI